MKKTMDVGLMSEQEFMKTMVTATHPTSYDMIHYGRHEQTIHVNPEDVTVVYERVYHGMPGSKLKTVNLHLGGREKAVGEVEKKILGAIEERKASVA